jgi:CheY-like chemotaxis protein
MARHSQIVCSPYSLAGITPVDCHHNKKSRPTEAAGRGRQCFCAPAYQNLGRDLGPRSACEVHECADGSEALDAYRLHQPDFVLMDVQMTTMDDITATAQLKAADSNAKIVMVTNYDQPDLREAALQAGAYAFVGKDDLLKLVHLLEREQA